MKTYKSTMDTIRLVREPSIVNKVHITCSRDVAEFSRSLYGEDISIYESFYAIFLNRANNTIGYKKIGQGGISSVVADVRLIAKYAIEVLASSVVAVHNHPSGNLGSSEADQRLTGKLKETLKIIGITLVDHIVLSPEDEKYISFADEGLI